MSSQQTAVNNMVKQQLRTGGVLDETILELYFTVPRCEFVPDEYKEFAYSDLQISLPHHQRMMTPLEEALILQELHIKNHETVLEIGTGSGFLTALLSRLCKKVISVDFFGDFTTSSRLKLSQHGCNNVELLTADACRGWLEQAPYEVMILTGAIECITDTHRLQLLPEGRLLAMVGKKPVMQAQIHTLSQHGTWQERVLFETNLPSLIDPSKEKEFIF